LVRPALRRRVADRADRAARAPRGRRAAAGPVGSRPAAWEPGPRPTPPGRPRSGTAAPTRAPLPGRPPGRGRRTPPSPAPRTAGASTGWSATAAPAVEPP